MRLLYFDPESNSHEGLDEAASSQSVEPGEVALVTSSDAIAVLIHSISEAFEVLSEDEFVHTIGVSRDQARTWQRRLAEISGVTYLPR